MRYGTVRAAVLLAALAASALAAEHYASVQFNSGVYSMALPATARCTTKWMQCTGWRFQALYWQQWIPSTMGDSSQMAVYFQVAVDDTTAPDSQLDSVKSICVGVMSDTTGAPKCFNVQFYPEPCFWVRFIFWGLTDNSDSTNIGHLRVTHDDGLE